MDQELEQLFASAKPAAFSTAPAPLAFAETSRPVHVTKQRQTLREARQTLKDDKDDDDDGDENDAAPTADGPTKQLKWDDSPEKLARTVFVGNVPISVVNSKRLRWKLRELFEPFGAIESLRFRSLVGGVGIVSKRLAFMTKQLSDKRHTCNCYLVFTTLEAAQAVVSACNGQLFEEHHLRVDLACNADGKPETKKSIFVGNLPLEVQDESLWRIFGKCGKVTNVRVIRDKSTGAGKGIAYVTFGERATVELALKLAGSECEGRPMRISKCAKAGYQEAKKAHQQRRAQALERRKEVKKDRRANQAATAGRKGREDRGGPLRNGQQERAVPRTGIKTPAASAGGLSATTSTSKHPAEIRKERKLAKGPSGANSSQTPLPTTTTTTTTKVDHRRRVAPPTVERPAKTAQPAPSKKGTGSRTTASKVKSSPLEAKKARAKSSDGSSAGTKRPSSQPLATGAAKKKSRKQ